MIVAIKPKIVVPRRRIIRPQPFGLPPVKQFDVSRCRVRPWYDWKWDRHIQPFDPDRPLILNAVAFDAKTSNWTFNNSTQSLTATGGTGLTMGTVSNGALLVLFMVLAGAFPTITTKTWNTSENLTLVPNTQHYDGASSIGIALYALLNPSAGNHPLTLSWSSAAVEAYLCAISFSGVDQTSVAVAFPHGADNSANGASPATVTITTAVGNIVVACHAQGFSAWGTVSGTTIATELGGANIGVVSNYDNGAASPVALTAAFTGTGAWASAGCDVLAASGGTVADGSIGSNIYRVRSAAWR